jgi:hypothetical protein
MCSWAKRSAESLRREYCSVVEPKLLACAVRKAPGQTGEFHIL